jgi:hypothetical protein
MYSLKMILMHSILIFLIKFRRSSDLLKGRDKKKGVFFSFLLLYKYDLGEESASDRL